MSSYLTDWLKRVAVSATSGVTSATPVPGLTLGADDSENGALFGQYKGKRVRVWREVSPLHVKRLKTIRHPLVLSYITDSAGGQPGSDSWLCTEAALELDLELAVKSPDYASLLAYQAASAVQFLNRQAGIVHGQLSSIASYLTDECGQLRITAFDRSVRKEDPEPPGGPLDLPPRCASWEEARQSDRLFSMIDPPALLSFIGDSLRLKRYGSLQEALDELESNRMVQLVQKLDSLRVDSDIDRISTVSAAAAYMQHGSAVPLLLVNKIMQSLLFMIDPAPGSASGQVQHSQQPQRAAGLDTVRVLGDCVNRILNDSKSRKWLRQLALECYSRLLAVNDRAVRLYLVEQLSKLQESLPESYLVDPLYPTLASGFDDASPAVRDATLKAIVNLSEKLPAKVLNSDVLRHLAKLQEDHQGGIRTNVIVGLGRMREKLNNDPRILGPAYCRGLQDPFAPARAAALHGLIDSHRLYKEEEIATRLLPATSPLLVDSDPEIRSLASNAALLWLSKFTCDAPAVGDKSPSIAAAVSEPRDLRPSIKVAVADQAHAEDTFFTDAHAEASEKSSQTQKPSSIGGLGRSRLGATRKIQ